MRVWLVVLVAVLSTGIVAAVWLSASSPSAELSQPVDSADPMRRAAELAESKGCAACHSLDGSKGIGPSWAGSFGAIRSFTDGTTAVVDDDYLRQSMQQPAVRVVTGFQNVMVAAELSEDEMAMLIMLIRALAADTSR